MRNARRPTHPAQVMPARLEQNRKRNQADDLRAGDAQTALACALLARVERHVQRRDIEIRQIDRDLRAAIFANHPADGFDGLEQPRLPDRLALLVEQRLAVLIALPAAALAPVG